MSSDSCQQRILIEQYDMYVKLLKCTQSQTLNISELMHQFAWCLFLFFISLFLRLLYFFIHEFPFLKKKKDMLHVSGICFSIWLEGSRVIAGLNEIARLVHNSVPRRTMKRAVALTKKKKRETIVSKYLPWNRCGIDRSTHGVQMCR